VSSCSAASRRSTDRGGRSGTTRRRSR
jgi:hypothetical protein